MIKKSISCILILSIFMYATGCFHIKETHNRENIKKISEGDDITITTIDNEVYTFTVTQIGEKEIYGTKHEGRRRPATKIVIPYEKIESIQVTKWTKNSTIALVVILGGVLVLIMTSNGILLTSH